MRAAAWILAAGSALAACRGTTTVAMRPVEAVQVSPMTGEAAVVFVRPPDPCSHAGAIAIVDENGQYVGESAPESQFAITMSEGDHVLYAWDPYGEIKTAKYPDINQVGVLRVHVEGPRPVYIEVTSAASAFEARKTCAGSLWAVLRRVQRNDDELDDWLRETRPFAPDHAAGQKWLDANAAETRRHMDMGDKKLAQRDERAKTPPSP